MLLVLFNRDSLGGRVWLGTSRFALVIKLPVGMNNYIDGCWIEIRGPRNIWAPQILIILQFLQSWAWVQSCDAVWIPCRSLWKMPAFSSRISHILPPVHHGLAHLQKGIASDRGAEVFILVGWPWAPGPTVQRSPETQLRSAPPWGIQRRVGPTSGGKLWESPEPNSLWVAPNGDRVLCPPYDHPMEAGLVVCGQDFLGLCHLLLAAHFRIVVKFRIWMILYYKEFQKVRIHQENVASIQNL